MRVFFPQAPGVAGLVEASYSYWLVGYLLSHSGATKLLRTQPLENMIAADEYVPLMYDKPYTVNICLDMKHELVAVK